MKSHEEFVNLIDEKFKEAKDKKVSRMSLEWGVWSADMNRELRTYTEDKSNPKQVLYQYTFIYWLLRSQLLELYFRGKGILSQVKIKKKIKEIKEVRKVLDLKIHPRNITKEEVLKRILEVT